mmetsp:Transcript_20664/g.44715  ORF Transcript_20664/g.44715 Transcript_20664/m.44715 type:complete len:198 (-) Transcript_20664:274-867(-)
MTTSISISKEPSETEIEIPEEFICPITQEIMADPVVSMYGQSFERAAILEWLASGTHDCPLSRRPLTLRGLITNHQLRSRIRDWQIKNEMSLVLIADPAAFDEKLCAFVNLDETSDTERLSSDDDEGEQQRVSVRRVTETSSARRRHRQTTNGQPLPPPARPRRTMTRVGQLLSRPDSGTRQPQQQQPQRGRRRSRR